MTNYFLAEKVKQKHSFNNKIIWLAPLVTIIIAFFLMGGKYLQTAAFNWWYILFLPFTLAYIASSIIKKENRHNFHGLLGITQNKADIWYAKIGIGTYDLFLTCIIFCGLITIGGLLFNNKINIVTSVFASLMLFLSFAWQVPLYMILTQKMNLFVSVILSILFNTLIACLVATKTYWFIIPFSIPARLMCPILNLMPNGLAVEAGSIYSHYRSISTGIIITIGLYILISLLTAKWFERQEM